MNFSKKLYKIQTITFGIMMSLFYLLAIVSIVGGIVSLVNTNNSEGAEGIGNAFLFVFALIGVIVGVALGLVMTIKLIATNKLFKAIKHSSEEFITKKSAKIVNLVFGILIIIAAIVVVLLDVELLFKIVAIILSCVILLFEILDGVALKKVRIELNYEANFIEEKK